LRRDMVLVCLADGEGTQHEETRKWQLYGLYVFDFRCVWFIAGLSFDDGQHSRMECRHADCSMLSLPGR
jgi:hypothetical protein